MQKSDCHLILGGEIDHKRVRNHWKSNILWLILWVRPRILWLILWGFFGSA